MTTILLTDDRRETLATLASRLQTKGFVVVNATHGKEAIEIASIDEIDAIIMDMNMPEMDGCEATEHLKANETTKDIPVILCTAHPLDGDHQRARESGCDAFIEKPIDFRTLLCLLGELLQEEYDLTEGELTNEVGTDPSTNDEAA